MKKKLSSLLVLITLVWSHYCSATEQDSVYLMSYFKGSAQKLFYAYSEDGLKWTDINFNEPVFDAYNSDINIRDPYLKRVTHNGETKFHLVHTMGWSNPCIFHWESTDLIHWTTTNGSTKTNDAKIYVMDGKNGNAKADNAWAPEFTYDPDTETFYIYWASDTGIDKQVHYYCTTKDWLTFTPSDIYFDPSFSTIDMTIYFHEGVYYGFYKDERNGHKRILLATSTSLDPAIDTFEGTKILFQGYNVEVEGPEIFKAIGEDRWYLYWDKFINDQGVSYATTTDLSSKEWTMIPDSETQDPTGVKHGSVEIISKDELTMVLKHFNKERVTILPTADVDPQEWKYTMSNPGYNWYSPGFNDSNWSTGKGGFGNGDVGDGVIGTRWSSNTIWLRKTIEIGNLSEEEIDNMTIRIFHDEDAIVYINGVLALSVSGYVTDYIKKDINANAKRAIVANGENTIAIRCTQNWGGQFIDVGLQTLKSEDVSSSIENRKENDLPVTYNPVNQSLVLPTFDNPSEIEIRIMDIMGRVVYQSPIPSVVDVSLLKPSVYIASIMRKGELLLSERFIKRN